MKTICWDDDYTGFCPTVATIGFFDGVHRGHRHLIDKVREIAGNRPYDQSAVFTFDTHPRMIVDSYFTPQLLTPNEEKRVLMSKTGIDNCIVLHFDEKMAEMTAFQFMKEVLHDHYNVKTLIIGYDHRFGHNRAETFDDYRKYGDEIGINVIKADEFTTKGVSISSSAIRKLIADGEVEQAGNLLGYRYFIEGKVIGGYREGHKIGFPTANIEVEDSMKLIPRNGVYAVNVNLNGIKRQMRGMMNIGNRPTFGKYQTTLEVNIFDFSDDIYGQTINVEFVSRLRDEHKFNNINDLIARLTIDKKMAEKILSKI